MVVTGQSEASSRLQHHMSPKDIDIDKERANRERKTSERLVKFFFPLGHADSVLARKVERSEPQAA